MTEALVNPKMLIWARSKAQLSIEEVAKKTNRPVGDIRAWEAGTARPTIVQARKFAQVVKQPFALLYLSEPPQDFQPLQDFRTIGNETLAAYSVELETLISTTLAHQEWTRDFLLSEGAKPLEFVGRSTLKEEPERLARKIRKVLCISVDDQINCHDRGDALRQYIHCVEEAQIFVVRDGRVMSSEARGFVLTDDIAPFVFINSHDSDGGKLFTLVHELAHLWIGASGLLDMERIFSAKTDVERIEKFCNEVASFLLLEPSAFNVLSAEFEKQTSDEFELIEKLSGRFKVSREVVARRLLDQQRIEWPVYSLVRDEGIKGWLAQRERRKAKSGGDSYWTSLARNGHAFTTLVLEAFSGGFVNCRDASALLSTKVNNLPKLASYAHFDLSFGEQVNA